MGLNMTELVKNALRRAEHRDIVDALNDVDSMLLFLRSPATISRALADPSTSYWLRDLLQAGITQAEAIELKTRLEERYQQLISAA